MDKKGSEKRITWDSKMKVLVTGGKGFIGGSVAGRLIELGYQVKTLSRVHHQAILVISQTTIKLILQKNI